MEIPVCAVCLVTHPGYTKICHKFFQYTSFAGERGIVDGSITGAALTRMVTVSAAASDSMSSTRAIILCGPAAGVFHVYEYGDAMLLLSTPTRSKPHRFQPDGW
jgi:hypothetical protein